VTACCHNSHYSKEGFCGHGSSNPDITHERTTFPERGSPSLVGRGIANPMSARTRGFKSHSPRLSVVFLWIYVSINHVKVGSLRNIPVRSRKPMETKIPIFEIWSNEDADEYAAKISGNPQFIMKTSFKVEYTRLVYAAPYVEKNLDGLAVILDKIVAQLEK
jgi:hypothetical protein